MPEWEVTAVDAGSLRTFLDNTGGKYVVSNGQIIPKTVSNTQINNMINQATDNINAAINNISYQTDKITANNLASSFSKVIDTHLYTTTGLSALYQEGKESFDTSVNDLLKTMQTSTARPINDILGNVYDHVNGNINESVVASKTSVDNVTNGANQLVASQYTDAKTLSPDEQTDVNKVVRNGVDDANTLVNARAGQFANDLYDAQQDVLKKVLGS